MKIGNIEALGPIIIHHLVGGGVDRMILVVLQQNLPDPLIRLCNILKIPPHLRLIGNQFST